MSALYKILIDGKSCHGGDQMWPMPNGKPGAWIDVAGDLSICSRGLHLTNKPHLWYTWGCECFKAEGKELIGVRNDKHCFRSARLLKKVKHPSWWNQAVHFVNDELPQTPWCKPDGKPLKDWKVFEADSWKASRDAAGSAARKAAGGAAWDAAWNAAWDAAWNAAGGAARSAARSAAGDAAGSAAWDAAGSAARSAAGDAVLMTRFKIVSDLAFTDKAKHLEHVKARWQVWQKGYALACDVNGVLYVYAKKRTP